ncbi:MAG TPA: elongation factor G [Kofleriaceae bacterium]|nr:elongation factor G [Kofleriaceae bacterium]
MKTYKPADVRVVGVFGHRGSGKTSAVEAFLYDSGATSRLGDVDQKSLTLDIDPVATDRQTTVHANVGFVEWDGKRIGLIDTPGDTNFWGATHRALHVVDAAIITVSAPDGVEPVTLRAIEHLTRLKMPFAVVVTKLDKEGADFSQTVDEIKAEMAKNAVPVALPMGAGDGISGIVNLLSQKAHVLSGDKTKDAAVPDAMDDEVNTARELLFDAVAAADDDLAEKYLEEGSLSDDELATGLRAAFVRGEVTPILPAIPTRNIGPRAILDLLAQVFPSPLDRPATRGFAETDRVHPVERVPDPAGPLSALVFRTFHDPFAGTLSFARIYSGTLTASADVYNVNEDVLDRPSHIFLPQGGTKAGVELKQATVGDLVVLTKLKETGTGDTLTTKDDPTFIVPFEEPDALLSYGVSAADKKDEDKLSSFLSKMVEEDPSLRFEREPDTKEMLLGGLGQAHIDYVSGRLEKAGLGVNLKEPKVPYRETVRATVRDIEGKHKKQSGGHGQFGVCFIHVEPLPRGSGFEFVDEIVGGAIPRQFIPSVEKGIRGALARGPLSGNEVVDIKVTLYDGKYHRVDSSDMAFQTAGRKAIREAFSHPKARPVLLEPYMYVEITCPADTVGDVMGDLNSRRARVSNMTTEGRRGRIEAAVPMNEILRYTNVLKSITSGRGSFTMRFDRYEEAPPNIQEQVMAAHKAEAHEED